METTMLASSAADQETKDSYRDAGHDTGHGLFAWVFGQALSGNGYVYNKTVTDGGLSSFVRDKFGIFLTKRSDRSLSQMATRHHSA